MNTVADRTAKTANTHLVVAAGEVFTSASASYEQALADQQRDIAQAAATKGHLGDGYWKPAHAARLRYLAALAVMEAVNEG
jgi:hypothetical protein